MNQDFYNAVREKVKISQQRWIEWRHEVMGLLHCGSCLSLHECWFVFENAPIAPLHEKCHCTTVAIPTTQVKNNAVATSAYSKFDPYLFNTWGIHPHGKDKLFQSWGYSVEDAKWLQNEIEQQGLAKYLCGEYTLNKLNHNGQRINITIEIPRKDQSGTVTFTSGWMVEPKGKIRLATPYGDK